MIQTISMTYKAFLKEKTDNWTIQFFRYIIVGGLSFLVDYGLLYLFTETVGMYYLASATLSFMAGLVFNYLISTRWIFNNSKYANKMTEFTIYGVIGGVGLVFNNLLLFTFTEIFHVHYMVSKLIVAAIVMIWNFVGRRFILFKK